MSRIAITGMGAVTPVGTGVGEFWRSLVSGRCGIGVLDRFTDEDIPVRVAALVRGFDAGLYMPGKLAKDSSRFSQ